MAKNGKQYAKISGTWHQIKPSYDDLTDIPTDFNPTTHTHGNINDDGQISASAPIASGDHLVIADHSANNDLTTSSITFGTGTTTFLRNDGTWGTPAGTSDTNNYLTGVSGSGDGTVTFTRQGLGNLTWNAAHSHSEYLLKAGGTLTGDLTLQKDGTTSNIGSHGILFQANSSLVGSGGSGDYTTELNMDYLGNLKFGGNTIFHAGNDGSASGLHADLLDGQQGSYYLNYNNLSNTPTIPTNNNQLTNGAGYITSFDITTQTDGKYLRSNANDDFSGTLNYTPDTGTILAVDGQAIIQRMTANGAITIGHDDAVIIAGGDTSVTLNGNINNATETVFVGAEGGFVAYAFPNNNTAWSNRKEMNWNGTNLTLLGNNVLTTADEGSGNGLDADTLDGSHASAFAAASHTHSQYAPLASPALTGTPTAPTPTAGDDDTSIATTAFVTTAIENLVNGASASFDTLKEIQDAMATDTELSNAINALTIGNGTQTISVGTGLDGGGSFTANQTGNSTVSISLDLSEFTDMTADVNGLADELILLDAGAERRKLISEIKLSQFNNDSGWTSNVGDITNVTANNGLTGGGSSGSVTISHADTSTQASVNNSGNTFIQDITLDTYGHITGITSATASTTDSTKLPLAGGTLTGDLTLDHDGANTANDSHALKFRARAAGTDFEREIKLEDGGGFAFNSNILLTGDVTTNNAARTIDFTGFDKEGTTDFSDRAYIQHTTNTGGHSGSVLVISSQNDSNDGIAFQTNASSRLKHNSNSIFTDAYHPNADKLTTARNIALTGAVTGNANFDGSSNISIATTATADPTLTINGDASGSATFTNLGNATLTLTVADDSHNHIISNVDGLQTALDGKASSSHTHSNYVAVSGDTMTGDLTLDHDGTGSAADSHGVVFTARFNSTDFTRELYMDDEANLLFGTNTIFHSGNDGSSSGLHADLLDGQQGSYYLDYNNFSNTPTIPTNNNQLTNGAGYVTGSHSHSTSNITSGEFNTARLGSGTATSGYVLKSDGDGTASWQQDNNTTYSLGSFGVTATAAELNKMDGVTATTTELNYTDGVTSNIQTQLNSKLSTSAAAAAVTYVTSCPTSTNSTGMKVYVGSTDCSTKYTGWLYIVT